MEQEQGHLQSNHTSNGDQSLDDLYQQAVAAHEARRYTDAESLYQNALVGYERSGGPEDVYTLRAVLRLGVLYHDTGRVNIAEGLLLRAAKGYEELKGLKDIDTLEALEYLGTTYRKMSKLTEAEAIHSRVLNARRSLVGIEHPTTLVAMNRLGMVYRAQGKLEAAEEITTQAWEICDRTLGPEHESTLRAFVSLGTIAVARGDFDRSREINEKALERYQRVFGPGHSSTQQVAANLATTYIHQEEFTMAEPLLQDLYQRAEREYGLKSIRTLTPLLNLSVIYDRLKRFSEAETCLAKVLNGYEVVFGSAHMKTMDARFRLAGVLERGGNLPKAEEILRSALHFSPSDLAHRDHTVIDIMESLARVLEAQEKLLDAQEIMQQLYEEHGAKHGRDSYLAIRALHGIGDLLFKRGKLAQAEATYERCTNRCKELFGDNDERTLYCLMSLCFVASARKRLREVEPHILQLFAKYDDTPCLQTLKTSWLFYDLSKELLKEGKIKEAEPLAIRAHEMSRHFVGAGSEATILFALNIDRLKRQMLRQDQGCDGKETEALGLDASTDSWIQKVEDILDRMLRISSSRSANLLWWLGRLYRDKFADTGEILFLDTAVEKFEAAVLVGKEEDAERSQWLSGLSDAYKRRFVEKNTLQDLRLAVKYKEAALLCDIKDSNTRLKYLDEVCENLMDLYEREESAQEVLDKAIRLRQEVTERTPLDHPKRGTYIGRHGLAHSLRYQLLGDIKDLENAFHLIPVAMQLTPKSDPKWSSWALIYAELFRFRFQQTGHLPDLEEAMCQATKALEEAPEKTSALWQTFARQLEYRYFALGDMEDLSRSIAAAENAVQLCPADDQYRSDYHVMLGNLLLYRFDVSGRQEDIDLAVRYLEQARDMPMTNTTAKGSCLSALGNAMSSLYQRTGEEVHLEAAIHNSKLALAAIPQNARGRADVMNNLSVDLTRRYRLTKRISDIDEAIDCARAVVSLRSPSHMNYPGILNNLANSIEAKFDETGDISLLNSALETATQAVSAVHAAHPARSGYLFNLGAKYHVRYDRELNAKDLDMASAMFLKGWKNSSGIVFDRVKAGSQAVHRLRDQGRLDEATEVAKGVVDLLPQVTNRTLSITDQQYVIKEFSGIARNACSLLLQAGHLEEALEYLERGRAVILDLLMGNRTDLTDLQRTYPEKAAEFTRLRDEINQIPDRSDINPREGESLIQRRLQSVSKFNECVQSIRRLPGHHRFLLGPTVQTMKAGAKGGHIVVVNISRLRSDAIIISEDSIQSIELPELSYSQAGDWLEEGLTRKGRNRAEIKAKNKRYMEFLQWLWRAGVHPILCQTKIKSMLRRPRIWWIGCGMASLLPFHAAGDYFVPDSREYTACYAISSYCSSIKSLFHARAASGPAFSTVTVPDLLIVGMPTTPQFSPLPGVEDEIERIKKLGAPFFSFTTLFHAPPALVRSKLPSCDMVHFACHAIADTRNPLNGHLLLWNEQSGAAISQDLAISVYGDRGELALKTIREKESRNALRAILLDPREGEEEKAADNTALQLALDLREARKPKPTKNAKMYDQCGALTVKDIVRMDLKRARIAYLSACSTAENKSARLLDEAIHLASAFQVAGFCHVLGTMWPAADFISGDIAVKFYQYLAVSLSVPGTELGYAVAEAFSRATDDARNEWPNQPLLWAQFVHYGT